MRLRLACLGITSEMGVSGLLLAAASRNRRTTPPSPRHAEACLTDAPHSITLVFSDTLSQPIRLGDQSIMRDLELLLAYYQGGEELRKHAERVLGFQKVLAQGGYRTGGNPPYGFARVLVDSTGTILEELPWGKTIKQPGCHVRAVPKDPEKIAVWLQILNWKAQGWGIKRIAQKLNALGVPSPDAGRTRTDHGVKHRVSGKWSPNTVGELCHNPIITGVQEYGKRSEGRIRRLGTDGPRLLEEEKDVAASGQLRIITNDPSVRISKLVGEAQFDPAKWQAIQQQMDQRGQTQRGIARAKDPARYPLACRLVDLSDGCGSILYARTSQGRAIYSCGRYARTAGAECHNNAIDAEAMLRFTLKTLRQLVERQGNREKLRQLLLERARQAAERPEASPAAAELARLRDQQSTLKEEQATIEYRMARERNDTVYEALTRQYTDVKTRVEEVEQAIRQLEAGQAAASARTPEQEVEAALGLLEDVQRITSNPQARTEINPLLRRLGIWIGLRFGNVVKGKKRLVRRLQSGVMTFGDGPLPVPLHGPDNVEVDPSGCSVSPLAPRAEDEQGPGDQKGSSAGASNTSATKSDVVCGNGRGNNQAAEEESLDSSPAPGGLCEPARPLGSQPEGISFTKVSRGDWIRTSDLLNPIQEVWRVNIAENTSLSRLAAF